jgi:hypothetical protein
MARQPQELFVDFVGFVAESAFSVASIFRGGSQVIAIHWRAARRFASVGGIVEQ